MGKIKMAKDFTEFWEEELASHPRPERYGPVWDRAAKLWGHSKGTAKYEILIDGDILCYKAASTTDGKHYIHPETDIKFRYMADAKRWCFLNDKPTTTLETKYDPEPWEHARYNLKNQLYNICLKFEPYILDGAALRIFLTGILNFRKEIVSTYKESREDDHRPFHLDACKEYLIDEFRAERVEGLEADDLMGCAAIKKRKEHHELSYWIVTTDKDLFCIPGNHYNPDTGEEKHTTRLESLHFFYTQLLIGDQTDNVKGVPGIGPKKADKFLPFDKYTKYKLDQAEWEMYGDVLKQYYDWCKKELSKDHSDLVDEVILHYARAMLETNAKQLWILQEPFVMWEHPRRPDELLEPKEAEGKPEEEKKST